MGFFHVGIRRRHPDALLAERIVYSFRVGVHRRTLLFFANRAFYWLFEEYKSFEGSLWYLLGIHTVIDRILG